MLDALRSSTLDFPNALSFSVIYEFSMDELTDPDEEVSVLTDVREPSGRYRDGLLITKDGHAVGRTERQRQRTVAQSQSWRNCHVAEGIPQLLPAR